MCKSATLFPVKIPSAVSRPKHGVDRALGRRAVVAFGPGLEGIAASQKGRFWTVVDGLDQFTKLLGSERNRVGVIALKKGRAPKKLAARLRSAFPALDRMHSRLVVWAPVAYAKEPAWQELLGNRAVDFLPDSVSRADLGEYLTAVQSRLESVSTARPAELFSRPEALEFLHHQKSGRLDIRPVSELYGLAVSEVARLIGVKETTAHRTPDSATVHERLAPFATVAGALELMRGDVTAFQRWLNTVNDELGGETPLRMIRQGRVFELAGLVRTALLGQPG